MNTGWICPRCGRVNAPFTSYCDCSVGIAGTPIPNQCYHNWMHESVSTRGTVYRCTKCGEVKIKPYDIEDYVMTMTIQK